MPEYGALRGAPSAPRAFEWDSFVEPSQRTAAPAVDSAVQRHVGRSIGLTHQVIRHLASGGMAHVFLAEHLADASLAAVKLSHGLVDRSLRGLLTHEAEMLSRVRHPHVVELYDVGVDFDGDEYLLLEYLDGIDLEEWQRCSRSPLPAARLVNILYQLARALDHLHARGVVHGDIKPANVMLNVHAQDHVTLVDFGLAFEPACARPRAASTGTPGYMAPEQERGDRCGPSIDRFALAAVACELYTGLPLWPRGANEPVTQLAKQALQLMASPRHVRNALEPVFERGLSDDPAARFGTAIAFVTAFASALSRVTALR
ncbi:MAG: serine/threonine-protein kinase [Polyangiales bacterium]